MIGRVLSALAILLGALLMTTGARAEPVRILIAAGNKQGLAAERPLKFAHNDARRVRDVMVSLGGVRNEHAFFLDEPTRSALYIAVDRAKAEARRHRAEEVTLVFYFSGHGDRDAIHLGGERVLIADLSTKLEEVPAGLRIAVTDACRATREKGFAVDEPFAISTTLIPQASGQVWLHASSDGEAAQESDDLQGAIFTHAWLSGLRGAADVNGDGRITLDESFSFAHSQTLIRSARSSGVVQKPEAIMSLREHAPVVITQTAGAMAVLALPKARDTHFLVYAAGSKSVLSELWGSPDRRLVLRVPPGRYVVHRRLGSNAGATQVALAEGEHRTLEDRDFSASELALLAKKGGDDAPDSAPENGSSASAASLRTAHEIVLGYDLGTNDRSGFVHGPRGGWAYGFGRLAILVGLGADFTDRSVSTKEESVVGTYGRAGLELRFPLGQTLTLRAGAGARAGVIWQSVSTSAVTENKSAFAIGPELALGARFDLAPRWFIDVTATGALPLLREENVLRSVPTVSGSSLVGMRF